MCDHNSMRRIGNLVKCNYCPERWMVIGDKLVRMNLDKLSEGKVEGYEGEIDE